MAIKNYTTNISVEKTVNEIQKILAKHKAKAILTEYTNNGMIKSLSFKITTPIGEIAVKLPCRIESVYTILKNQKESNYSIKATEEQAYRVGWRNIKDWIDAQMALVETEMVSLDEVFLPYITNTNDQTLYEVFKENKQMLIGGNTNDR